jgi:hypothetical protein
MHIKDDKVLLDHLFKNKKIVPSALFQGHLAAFKDIGGESITGTETDLAKNHTLLPLFKPFIPKQRYQQLLDDLLHSSCCAFTYRSGVNASLVQYPKFYKICNQCLQEQKQRLGYVYAQRLFQCPGVDVCPEHGTYLHQTDILISSDHKHHFTGLNDNVAPACFTMVAQDERTLAKVQLSRQVSQLLNTNLPTIDYFQWTRFYFQLATNAGMVNGKRINHHAIASRVKRLWSEAWLEKYGLTITSSATNWLVHLFRKHRRSFSYLQHFVVWLALDYKPKNLMSALQAVSSLSNSEQRKTDYAQCTDKKKLNEYRNIWLNQIKEKSLKQVRATREGSRVYSWLFRYDHDWLTLNKPQVATGLVKPKVNWLQRDAALVRQLLKTLRSIEDVLHGPRRSAAWFALQIQQKTMLSRNICKLPLCRLFFIKYAETVDEYQTRRLAFYLSNQINNNILIGCVSDVERAVGINKRRAKECARKILEVELPAWQRNQKVSTRCYFSVNRYNCP